MALSVALYAEGAGETRGEQTLLPAPGQVLDESHLGPVHRLLRRVISAERHLPETAISFMSPLRVRGRIPRGSDFLHRLFLRQLLTWFPEHPSPDLAIVIVDADGNPSRKHDLEEWTKGLPVPRVIGLAVNEFEAWLIADHVSVASLLATVPQTPPNPESMAPGAAKALFATWYDLRLARDMSSAEFRASIARSSDLAVIARACPSFDRLGREIGVT
jgi:uncharacterized protein DUF4276